MWTVVYIGTNAVGPPTGGPPRISGTRMRSDESAASTDEYSENIDTFTDGSPVQSKVSDHGSEHETAPAEETG